ncbi:MAG: ArdC-like ssDNA-binding domain-containing protein [Planctomycetota bacterium]
MATKSKRRRRRRESTETREQQLARIQASDNESNYPAIVAGFTARGIPAEDIQPRENVLTYRAWQAKGRQVRKGEKSVKIEVWIEYEQKDAAEGEEPKGRTRRSVAVFHVSQTDPIEGDRPLPETRPDSEKPNEDKPQPRRNGGNDPKHSPRRKGVSSERLRTLADNMQTKIDAKLDPAIGRQNWTRRRAGIAASMREEGYALQRIQSARRKMADAIDAGELPDCLAGVYSEGDLTQLTSEYWTQGNGRERLTQAQRDGADWLAGEEMELLQEHRESERRRAERLDRIMRNPPDGFFPTPSPLAARMVELAKVADGCEVLEPSAGMGHIAEAIVDDITRRSLTGSTLITIERDRELCEWLEEEGHPTHCADILDVSGQVDRVVMNPPYEKRQDIKHVRHCFEMLKPGGRLVALMAAGFETRADRETCEFREWLESDEVREIHRETLEDAFKGRDSLRQTGVRVVLIVLHRPNTDR